MTSSSHIELPDWKAVLVILLNAPTEEHLTIKIPSPALAYSQWELRGFLGIRRNYCVDYQVHPGEWLQLYSAELFPFYFKDGMFFRTDKTSPSKPTIY